MSYTSMTEGTLEGLRDRPCPTCGAGFETVVASQPDHRGRCSMTVTCSNEHECRATFDSRFSKMIIQDLFEALLKTIDNQPKLYRAARLYLQES